MTDEPVSLDAYRDNVSKKAARLRRSKIDVVESERQEKETSEEDLEQGYLDNPARNWPDVAAKARYLVTLFAATPDAYHPRRKKLISQVLEELARLSSQSKDSK